ncbi:MAG: Peroxiredoxin, partial [Planctomycetaceae bacterium]|nr:Peroxiredoxin [Planctomycetaceae bacterium]
MKDCIMTTMNYLRSIVVIIALSSGFGTSVLHAWPDGAKPQNILDRELVSAEGSASSVRTLQGKRATVLVFLSTECPISNSYIATLNELAKQFAEQGVTVIGLNPNDGVSLRDLAEHRKEFAITFPVLRDSGAVIASQLAIAHCPEVVLLNDQGTVQYQGRIDERYARRGAVAGEIRRRDLSIAVEELLSGKPVSITKTAAVGCPISRPILKTIVKQTGAAEITYSGQIATLLQKNCQSCHRPGGIGPFSLLTYEQAVSWADDLKEFTSNRQMPPWLPTDGFGEFHNRRAMSEADIALVAKWVDGGCVAGDLTKLPPAITYQDGWMLGEPDKIIQPAEPFQISADGKDVYRCFVIPTDYETDQYVSAIEVRPGNTRVVHHVINFIDTTGRSLELDAQSPGQGYATSAGFPGFLPAGSMGGWAPGNLPQVLPDGMARVLPAKANLVIQVHYHPSGKPEQDQTLVGLHFSKKPVTRTVRIVPVMPFGGPWSGMKILAGDANSEVRTSMVLPRDSIVLNVMPHMHLLGKDMRLTAVLPDGTQKPLIDIKRWDFNWQESYQYLEPVQLPKGTRLDLVAHFDNSVANPSNPNSPPKEVRWGEQTTSEMCIAFLQVAPAELAKSAKD